MTHLIDMTDDGEDESQAKEEAHHRAVCHVFRTYRRYCLSANQRRRKDFLALPQWQQALLPDYLDLLSSIDAAIIQNQHFLDVIALGAEGFLYDSAGAAGPIPDSEMASDADYDKVKSCLRQITRDWCAEGSQEREACYGPILEALQSHTSTLSATQRVSYQVLCPGAGLARLVWEVVKLGYSCQGNESSLYMLFVSQIILNLSSQTDQHSIHPFVHTLSNVATASDILKPFTTPDVLPSDLPQGGGTMSMSAGDFVEVYSKEEERGSFDAVLTCFFMDTASNVIEYLATIRNCLKPNGIWINLGPLLWHHENSESMPSLELTLEDFKSLAGRMGFALQNEKMVPTRYTSFASSMMSYEYSSSFFTATKIRPIQAPSSAHQR